jgi:hypothetical protein
MSLFFVLYECRIAKIRLIFATVCIMINTTARERIPSVVAISGDAKPLIVTKSIQIVATLDSSD